MPSRCTQPLSDSFVSDGPELRRVVGQLWKDKTGKPFELRAWQSWLIDRVLERYPDDWPVEELRGQLRYREVLITMGRQNGKTILAAVLSFYGLLMHVPGASVIGLSATRHQADYVYNATRYVIDNTPALARRFTTSGTRGIRSIDRTRTYLIKPGTADALQGQTITYGLLDEVHLIKAGLWSAMAYGMSAVPEAQAVGISTAGDPDSAELIHLYSRGARSVAGESDEERFGFFCWEAPEDAAVDDEAALLAANPSVASGDKSLAETVRLARTTPEPEVRQFMHNRFVTTSAAAWIRPGLWGQLGQSGTPAFVPTHVAVGVTPGQEWATVTLARKDGERVSTAVLCHVRNPSVDRLAAICEGIARQARVTFVMEGTQRSLADRLRKRGMRAEFFNAGQLATAAATAHRKIVEAEVSHDGSALTGQQMGRGTWKASGGVAKLIQIGNADVDALTAQVMAIHAADVALIPQLGIKAA